MLRFWYLYLAFFVAFLAWRVSHVTNVAFRKRVLPSAYFATPTGIANASTSCKTVSDPKDGMLKYCEDAALWDYSTTGRIALISCDMYRKTWNTAMGPLREPPSSRGALYAFHFDAGGLRGEPHYLKLEGYPDELSFHPLGLQAWPSNDRSPSNMFVVNDRGNKPPSIELFTITLPLPPKSGEIEGNPRIRWIRSISSPLIHSPNSVALTSPTSFFVSNDHLMTRRLPGFLGKFLPLVETLLALPLGFISHVEIVKDDLQGSSTDKHTLTRLFIPFPNGIALRQDGRSLAVASSSLAAVYIYDRFPLQHNSKYSEFDETGHAGKLILRKTISLPFAPDNVRYDDSGSLLVAGHPYFPDLIRIGSNISSSSSNDEFGTGTAPSWVSELTFRNYNNNNDNTSSTQRTNTKYEKYKYDLKTIYQSDGLPAKDSGAFSSSSTGVRDSRTGVVIISGLFAEEGVLICTCVPQRKNM